MSRRAILAVDQGTTNSKAILVDEAGTILASGAASVQTRHPQSGWVEQDAGQIWSSIIAAIKACRDAASDVEIAAIGISNQRESVLAWDRASGEPLGPVITWQCRRTARRCNELKNAGHEEAVIARTGLPLDPLFPATKLAWLLEHCAGDRNPADICLGTVDSWLIWNFTGGAVHATDASNASRTQLFNIGEGCWDDALADLFGVSSTLMPEVRSSASIFGTTKDVAGLRDGLPVAAAIGDSHAALFGHGAFKPGDGKITFGTGSSVMTTIPAFRIPPKGLTTTIAWSLDGTPTFAFEGNILVSASILPWTAELLGLKDVATLLERAESVDSALGVKLVPAHVGLGSPHWNADARGLLSGLSFASGPAHVARAAAESIAFQVGDVFRIVAENAGQATGQIFADGGPSQNRFLMQLVTDYLDHPLTLCPSSEASARGAAYMAGLAVGFWPDLATVAGLEAHGDTLRPQLDAATRSANLEDWERAIGRSTLGT